MKTLAWITLRIWPTVWALRVLGKIDHVLFLTHNPWFFKIGDYADGSVITRIEFDGNTLLVKGGVAPCYRVLGRKI